MQAVPCKIHCTRCPSQSSQYRQWYIVQMAHGTCTVFVLSMFFHSRRARGGQLRRSTNTMVRKLNNISVAEMPTKAHKNEMVLKLMFIQQVHKILSLRAGSLAWVGYRGQRTQRRQRTENRRTRPEEWGEALFLAPFFSPALLLAIPKQVSLLAGYKILGTVKCMYIRRS